MPKKTSVDSNETNSWFTDQDVEAHVKHMNEKGEEFKLRKLERNLEAQVESSRIPKDSKQ